MDFPNILNNDKAYYHRIIKMNKKTERYGLILTMKDAVVVLEERDCVLKHHGIVELDIQVTEKIIELLSSSPYVNKENFIETILDIQEIFYYIKSETNDGINDKELLAILSKCYEDCSGTIELLRSKETDRLIREINLKILL